MTVKDCPLCGADPERCSPGQVVCTNLGCLFFDRPCSVASWQALPRVVPNADKLLDLYANALFCDAHPEKTDDEAAEQYVQEARAACLAAMVVVPVTAEKLWAEFDRFPLKKNGTCEAALVSIDDVKAAFAALEKKP